MCVCVRERERERERERDYYCQLCVGKINDAHLSQSFSVGAHISKDNENVFLTLIGHELGSGEGQTGSDDTLNTAKQQQMK